MTREPARKVSQREQERLRQLGSRDLIPLPTLLRLSTSPPTAAASSPSLRPPASFQHPSKRLVECKRVAQLAGRGALVAAGVLGHAAGAGLGAG